VLVGIFLRRRSSSTLPCCLPTCLAQVSPGKTPQVVAALLDSEAPEEFVTNLILSVRSLLPVDKLVEVGAAVAQYSVCSKVAARRPGSIYGALSSDPLHDMSRCPFGLGRQYPRMRACRSPFTRSCTHASPVLAPRDRRSWRAVTA
jgi:hypothetical protein